MPGNLCRDRDLVRWKFVWLAVALFVFLPACGSASRSAPEPTSTPLVLTSPTATDLEQDELSLVSYGVLIRQVFSDVADLTRILSDVSIRLGSAPETAPQAASIVNTTKGTFELVRDRLASTSAPVDHGMLRQLLLDALELYAAAAAALLPNAETNAADYWSFQGLMQEAGKNFHAAGEEFDRLRP